MSRFTPSEAGEAGRHVTQFRPEWVRALLETEGRPAALRDGYWVGQTAIVTSAARDAICLHDADGTFQWVSDGAENVLGWSPASLVGRDPFTFHHQDDLERIRRDSYEPLMRGEQAPSITYRFRRAGTGVPRRLNPPPASGYLSRMPLTVYIETYGCQMNVADSELMYGSLAAHGYEAVDAPDGADVILVNTCAIRDHAEQRVIGRLGELRRFMKADSIVGVTGCMAQRLGPRLLEKARHVSLVVGPDGYRALPQLIDNARGGERGIFTTFDLEEHYEDVTPRRTDPVKAWIPVQRGCDYRCTYCIVPHTRGAERSRQLHEVVREVRQVVDTGTSEIVLLGQTVNSYHDGTHDFADLLRAVGAVDGVRRLRYTSPHPNDFSDRVIEAHAEVAAVCEHIHLPMQSGSSRVLKRMLRRYTREEFLSCVERLRAAIPDLVLTTDVIVGFPGETDVDFADTLTAVTAAGFSDAFTFKFSPREGTPATRLPAEDTVPDEVASERLARLIQVVRTQAREENLGLLGSRAEVLIERLARDGALLMGRTRDWKTVLVPGDASLVNSYHTVELTGTTGSTFTGTFVTGERPARQPLPMAG